MVRTPRKERLWTTATVQLTLSSAGVAGSNSNNLSTPFVTKAGRQLLKGDTLAHTWLKGVWTQSAAGDSSRERVHLGILFHPTGLDAIDFPDLSVHDGDLQLHDSRGLREPLVIQDPMVTPQMATVDIESAGQRMVRASGAATTLSIVGQTVVAPSAGSFEFTGACTCLWLI